MIFKKGFYTALGSPLDEEGNLVEESLVKEINMQIEAGASGLLLLGGMGNEVYIKLSTYKEIVRVGASANNGRIPMFVGAMDCSITKVMEKINSINGAKIDGIVLTTPFYYVMDFAEIVKFYTTIADRSPYPIFLYDMPAATQMKITLPLIDKLITHPNIHGIKSADWELLNAIKRKYPDKNFNCLYSGLDNFDYANMIGLEKNLDGMFTCCPKTTRKLFDCLNAKDFVLARKYLDEILLLRDTMLSFGLGGSFTYCMNALGMNGLFHEDYCLPITKENEEVLKNLLINMGEI